ncbi:transporter suffix domain-containing protein [uncultured Vibrio sp.]|uniref:transporter suffix domain-containing protein n=1 Tax=uncultured Vibrio sp. TaxID=114054 RepID=UPI0025E9A34D|nr:transporter suffix domain-containing protein [uncultured Vibrio sp.]
MTRSVKVSIALVFVYLVVWAGVLGLPFTNLPKDKVDSWVSNLIVVEEVLSLVCIVLIGKIILTDVKASLTQSS